MTLFHSLIYVAFLISFAQCQTTLNQAEISKLLQIIQNQQGVQTNQVNNAETMQLIQKLMASSQRGNQVQQANSQPRAPVAPRQNSQSQSNLLLPLAVSGAIDNPLTALAATSLAGNQRGGAGPNLNGYLTARAFDFNDMATNMMLFNGLNGNKQPTQSGTQPGTQPTNQPPTQPPRQQTNNGLFGQSPMGNYFTARAFDFPDMYTSMMLLNGLGGRQQQANQPGNQPRTQSTFDPTLFYLSAF